MGPRGLVPPAGDNRRIADRLHGVEGAGDPLVQLVAVRPDSSCMAIVAIFRGNQVADAGTWGRWAGRLPVITDGTSPSR